MSDIQFKVSIRGDIALRTFSTLGGAVNLLGMICTEINPVEDFAYIKSTISKCRIVDGKGLLSEVPTQEGLGYFALTRNAFEEKNRPYDKDIQTITISEVIV